MDTTFPAAEDVDPDKRKAGWKRKAFDALSYLSWAGGFEELFRKVYQLSWKAYQPSPGQRDQTSAWLVLRGRQHKEVLPFESVVSRIG